MISRDQLQRGAADGGFQIEPYEKARSMRPCRGTLCVRDGASQWSWPAARELCPNASSGGTVS